MGHLRRSLNSVITGILLCCFAGLPLHAAEQIKTVGAVAKANLKTIGAVAEANLKAIGAVDNTSAGGGTPAFVNTNQGAGSGGSTTIALTNFNLDAGGYVLVFIAGTLSVSSVSVGGSAAARIVDINEDDPYFVELWGIPNVSNNDTATITATFSGSATFRVICAVQYSGIATSSATDGASQSIIDGANVTDASPGTTRTSANITTTNATDLLVAIGLEWNTAKQWTGANGYTIRTGSTLVGVADRYVTSTGSHPGGNFATASSDNAISLFVALKAL